jgi:NADPH:quinone reductase-like Zn-dependent oxidoreductase
MSNDTGLQLRSLIKSSGELELSLVSVPTPKPADDEIVIRVEATPINPSDLGLLLGPADVSTIKATGSGANIKVTATVPQAMMRAVAGRVDESMPVGNEGAGTVVAAGSAPAAQALMGKKVAAIGGAMYSQFRVVKAADVLPLPAGATSADGASCFVNPLTALAMVETMRMENHKALVHTAAASNLGQMLVKICLADGVGLVNVVRSAQQAAILRELGAKHIVDSTSPSFMDDLVAALVATGATLAFDAVGGGRLAGQLLTGMEIAANKTATTYSRYGSNTFKQVYIYGALDTRPTELVRNFGFSWALGGFLLTPFLAKIGPAGRQKLQTRVANELKTTFASHYTRELSLEEALQPDAIAAYNRKATGEKFLIVPNKG